MGIRQSTATYAGSLGEREKYEWIRCLSAISKALIASERLVGQFLTGLVLAFLLLKAVPFYIAPYSICAPKEAPFTGVSRALLRIIDGSYLQTNFVPLLTSYLSPVLAAFVYLPLFMKEVFLGSIYAHFRREGHSPLISLVASSTMAFSTPIFFAFNCPWFSDITTYLFLFWCMTLRKSKVMWVVPLSLACLSQEPSLAAIPWVIFLRTRYYDSSLCSKCGLLHFARDVLLGGFSVLPLLLLRNHLSSQSLDPMPALYFSTYKATWQSVFSFAGLGIFEAFRLFWFLPIAALCVAERGERSSICVVLVLMSAAGISQMFFSQDISRYLGHAFPAILYSLDLIARRKILGSRLAEVLVILVLCNLLVPQYYVGQRDTTASLPWVLTYFFKVTGLNP